MSASASGTTAGEASSTCDLQGCTVTVARGVNAKASVLGVDVAVTGVTGDKVTLQVGGQSVDVPLNGQGSAEVAGLTVSVQKADAATVVLRIGKA